MEFARWPDPGADVLLGLLRCGGDPSAAERLRALSRHGLDDLLGLAHQHGVASLLHRALQSNHGLAALPDHACARLVEARRATALDNLRNFGEFRRIARALQERGIPVIALKGLHLAELVYRDISLRPMSDVDILVPESAVDNTVATLQGLDYDFAAKTPSGYDVSVVHRYTKVLVEAHWGLAAPREPHGPAVDDVWRLARPAKLGDADALVMPPEFLLLHVCSHLACHHFFALDLRALCDIAEIVRGYPLLDWGVVVDQARRHGDGRGVGAALRLAREQLGTAIPESALAAIGADALEPDMLADALEQLGTFSGIRLELRFAPNLVGMTGAVGAIAKISTLWRRIFISRADMASIYGVPEQSARIVLFYAVRLWDLLRKYARSAWALTVSNPQLAATAERHARLTKWIAGT